MGRTRYGTTTSRFDAGESIKALSEYLGHHDPGFMLRTYTHLMPYSTARTQRAIDSLFGDGEPDVDGPMTVQDDGTGLDQGLPLSEVLTTAEPLTDWKRHDLECPRGRRGSRRPPACPFATPVAGGYAGASNSPCVSRHLRGWHLSRLQLKDQRKQQGAHYTPAALAAFLAQRAVACMPIAQRGPVRVLDPACGDGELLLAARSALCKVGCDQVELVGFDVDPGAIIAAQDRFSQLGIYVKVQGLDFLHEAKPEDFGKFDLLITNPPYVRTQVLGSEAASKLAMRYRLTGRVDLAHAFIATAPLSLSADGVLALLCSNRFLSTRAGSNVRRLFAEELSVREVYDLGDTKIFEAAVLPAIVIASSGVSNDVSAKFAISYEATSECEAVSGELYHALVGNRDCVIFHGGRKYQVSVGGLDSGASPADPWRLSSVKNEQWLRRIEKNTWRTFGQLAKIRVGIKTTADSVFIREDWESVAEDCRPEEELLLPLLTHRNVQPWQPPTSPSTRVLYPYDLNADRRRVLDLTGRPRAKSYFAQHRERLAARKYVIEGGRQWFEIWVPQKPAKWRRPKIVFPDISEDARFAIDRSGAVVNGDCYWIDITELPSEDLAYLMVGVANSSTAVKFYDLVCGNKLYAGRRRWITQYVGRFPVPDPCTVPARRVVALARELCDSRSAPSSAALADLDTAVLDAFSINGPCPVEEEVRTTPF
jgi:adenine-specific DNA-methyltransferase